MHSAAQSALVSSARGSEAPVRVQVSPTPLRKAGRQAELMLGTYAEMAKPVETICQ